MGHLIGTTIAAAIKHRIVVIGATMLLAVAGLWHSPHSQPTHFPI